MRFSSLIPVQVLGLVFALYPAFSSADGSSYFMVDQPTKTSQWVNGVANPITWTKGLLDGVDTIDLELARLSSDGLIFVARNVPAKSQALNVMLQDVPAADDYYLLFINSTHGVMYSISQRFSILDASSASSAQNTSSPVASASTVTVSGGPNPTAAFATTFPALSNAAVSLWRGEWTTGIASVSGAVVAGVVGAVWTLL